MRVVPEEADGCAHHGAAKDSELADFRLMLYLKIIGEHAVAAHISEHCERAGRDHGATDGESIQAVCQVHGVAGSNNHEHYQDDEGNECEEPKMGIMQQLRHHQLGAEPLEERDDQSCRVLAAS